MNCLCWKISWIVEENVRQSSTWQVFNLHNIVRSDVYNKNLVHLLVDMNNVLQINIKIVVVTGARLLMCMLKVILLCSILYIFPCFLVKYIFLSFMCIYFINSYVLLNRWNFANLYIIFIISKNHFFPIFLITLISLLNKRKWKAY